MMIDIDAALRELEQLVKRIAELAEWQKVAAMERTHNRPFTFHPTDHFLLDMEDLYASGWSLAAQIREALERPDLKITPERRQHCRHKLLLLEERANQLATGARFIT